ncbi:MAG: MrpF/PhaF family protein [Desulfurococcaceae archaeon TW002]
MILEFEAYLMIPFIIAMIIYSVRAFTSKNLADMVLAIDALTVDLVVILVLIALYYRSPYLLIGAVPLSAWIFILDLAVAKYLHRGGKT